MDTLSHAVGGFLLGWILFHSLTVGLIFTIFGILPDVIGYAEKLYKHDPDYWDWYVWAHKRNIFWVIPSYALHCILDKYTHGKNKRWWVKGERLWAEILYWIILTIGVIFSIFIL